MENSAEKLETGRAFLEHGEVLSVGKQLFVVLASFGSVQAEKAVSCLITPTAGDRVLISMDESGDCYILSVLRRAAGAARRSELLFDGDVALHVSDGGLSVTSDQGVSLTAAHSLEFDSNKISVRAVKGDVLIEKLSLIVGVLKSQAKKISMVANRVENTFHRLTQRLHDSFRFVKDLEEVQSGSTRYLVEETLTMHSKNAVHMAEELVTIQAEQIHMG